ncbi:MAG: HAD hydrolase-like protein [Anaerolineales bacterium]|nr:HAD hydrolase-like protein [Anaerolineales bacterium]
MPRFDVIAFDADDTLWHNERYYHHAQDEFKRLMLPYANAAQVEETLYTTEVANLPTLGFGIKAFILSMIETAVSLTNGRISGTEIQNILDLSKTMLPAKMELFDHVANVIDQLSQTYPLMIITKGDLLDQELKIERSGIAAYFQYAEIVSHKNVAAYGALLERHQIQPERVLMVGNSLRSDIRPLLDLGAAAVYIPNTLTWTHETAVARPVTNPNFYEIEHIGLLPDLLAELTAPAIK